MKRHNGFVLLVSLIMMIVMTLGALAMVRSLNSATLIAGNLGFRVAALNSADSGLEAATNWLQINMAMLADDDANQGYYSAGIGFNPAAGQTWDAYWKGALAAQAIALPQDAMGNTTSYVVHRMCTFPGNPGGGNPCSFAPISLSNIGEQPGKELYNPDLNPPPQVYYRITARVQGPRNSSAYTQAYFAQ